MFGGSGSGGQYGFNGGNGLRGNYGGDSGHYEEGGGSFYGNNTYGAGGDGRRRYSNGWINGENGNNGIVVIKSFLMLRNPIDIITVCKIQKIIETLCKFNNF